MEYTREHCINCGLSQSFLEMKKCSQCGHDQNKPVIKKTTNFMDMANSTISLVSTLSFRDDGLIKHITDIYEISQDESLINRITSIALLSNLAIAAHLYKERYQNNINYKKIFKYFDISLKAYLESVYEEGDINKVEELLNNMLEEYIEVLRGDKWLENATRVLQSRIESAILSLPLTRDLVLPDIHTFILYFNHQSNFMLCLQTVLNKWEIEEN